MEAGWILLIVALSVVGGGLMGYLTSNFFDWMQNRPHFKTTKHSATGKEEK